MREENTKSIIEQLQLIKIGRGVQFILDEAHRILGNQILILDMEYKLVACTRNPVADDPIWNEFMQYGRLSSETIDFFREEGFIDAVANSTLKNGVTYLASSKLKYDRVFGQLYNKDRVPVADLIVMETGRPFSDDILGITKVLCDVLSKEMSKNAYYLDYGQTYKENVVRELLDGNIPNKQIYAGHIANIDRDLKTNIFIAVADMAQCESGYARLGHYRDLLKRTQPSFEYYIYRNYIVILMSWDDDALEYKKKDIKKLCRVFERENIYAGISSSFENLFEMPKYYAEAVKALNYGLIGDGTERIHSYDEIKQPPL